MCDNVPFPKSGHIYLDLQILSLLPFRFHNGLSPATARECLPHGGLKLKKSKKYCPGYDCSEYFTQLHKTFHIEVRHDNPLVHPPSFCSVCYGIMRRTMTALDSWTTYTPASTPTFHCEPHTKQECRVRLL